MLCALPLLWVFGLGCEGPAGPAGKNGVGETGATGEMGAVGATGANGEMGVMGGSGTNGCAGLAAGQTRGIVGAISVSSPLGNDYFAVGETATLTIKITDRCGQTYAPSALGAASLYLYGPRSGLTTTTACGLLNCVTDRTNAGHHHIDLNKPVYADTTKVNLKPNDDGSLTYTLNPVTTELPGTYTAVVLANSIDDIDQLYAGAELQIGTPTREEFSSGTAPSQLCGNCHMSPVSGHVYMHHSETARSIFGSFNYDSTPIATCLACHNSNGYSVNTIVDKVHAIHRGAKLTHPGGGHPEYGLPADASIADFTNVVFPRLPDGERDCASCHADDRWQSKPSRLACGTCHDNLFFNTGTLNPPRRFTKVCASDGDCVSLGSFTSCDPATLLCVRSTHPALSDDTQCLSCHGVGGFAPVAAAHEVYQRTRDPGLKLTNVVFTKDPASTIAPAFWQPGDLPILKFQLQDAAGNFITDVVTNTAVYGANVTVAGPTNDPAQLYPGSLALATTGTFTYDTVANVYTYTFASPLPANAVPPLNSSTAATYNRPNPAGTYTLWLWVFKRQTINGESVRNTGSTIINFPFIAAAPLQPRQVISGAACDSCHDKVQAHGGTRQEPSTCYTCHTPGAEDKGIGATRGVACLVDTECMAGWETCQNKLCTTIKDPTPGTLVDFRVFMHKLHFARLLDGYAELGNMLSPGQFQIYGASPALAQILIPQDIRSCQTCHTDSAAKCSATLPCGYGQSCVGGVCNNTAWQAPSTTVCLSCHDSADAYGHAALNTWSSGGTSIETCDVCHGTDSQFSVKNVHDITNPYVPPYFRDSN